jgi:hypothetical protein
MPKSSKVIKKSTSARIRRRQKTSSSIFLQGSFASEPCYRCVENNRNCVCIEDGRCVECVLIAMEQKCDAKIEGPLRSVRELVEKKAELERELQIIAESSAKAARLSKVIKSLEARSKRETIALTDELVSEESGAPEDPTPSSVDESMEWFDRMCRELNVPNTLLLGFVDESS